MKPLIYLASPYTNQFQDVVDRRVRQVTYALARLTERGHIIFSPIVHSHPLAEQGLNGTWESWREIDTVFLTKSDELWILKIKGWDESVGVKAEMDIARSQGKKISFVEYPNMQIVPEGLSPQPASKVLDFPKAQGKSDLKDIRVFGLAGFAQSGKDTLGKYLIDKYKFNRVSFADGVREALLALNPLVDVRNDHSLPSKPARYCLPITDIVSEFDWEDSKKLPEVRQLLQRMGTEVGRNIFGENCWIDIARRKAGKHSLVVFTDVRFPNEAELVREMGGAVIRINREGVKAVNGHSSENPLPDSLIDVELQNNGTIEDLYRAFEEWNKYEIAA